MSAKPPVPNSAHARLLAEGYEAEVRQGHLLVHSVPYVAPGVAVSRGTLICTYVESGGVILVPDNHQVWFAGDFPCFADGRRMTPIEHSSARRELAPGIVVDHHFSNKPEGATGFPNNYDKIIHYLTLLQDQARVLAPGITSQTWRSIAPAEEHSVFKYADTASVRSETVMVSRRLALKKVGIVGMGGSGGYVFDQVAKTLVEEIHTFDGDEFLQHNAFRAPGAASIEQIGRRMPKVEYFREMYAPMRHGIVTHPYNIDASNVAELAGFDFVFICVDHGPTRRLIADYLISQGIAFVDTGMSVEQDYDTQQLDGLCRVTFCTSAQHEHFHKHAPTDEEPAEALYRQNIQVADLNALNAILAVILWKQHFSFYVDDFNIHHATFSVRHMLIARRVPSEQTESAEV